MPKRPDWSADLMTIGLFAPLVMASRLQGMALEGMRPSAKGRREAARMTAEKPLAFLEAGFAVQKQMLEAGFKFWSDMFLAANALATAPVLASASAPIRRRVRANARRMTSY